eukprot:PhF_6_TR6785/c0_g1_i1/m.9766
MDDIDRFPVAFKTIFRGDGSVCRHIVLVTRSMGIFGAVGLSRKANLMNKDLIYPSLSELIHEYIRSYHECRHEVVAIKIGLPVEHDRLSTRIPIWRYLILKLSSLRPGELTELLNNFATMASTLMEVVKSESEVPSCDSSDVEGGGGGGVPEDEDSDNDAEVRQRLMVVASGMIPCVPKGPRGGRSESAHQTVGVR